MTAGLPKGFTVRPVAMEDLKAAVALFNACSMELIGAMQHDVDETRVEWGTPGFNLKTDTQVVLSPAGEIVGYSEVWDIEEPHVQIWSWGRVHPDYKGKGIGTYLLRWAEAPVGELTGVIRSLSRGKLGIKRAQEVQARAATTIGQTTAPRAARAELNWLLKRIGSWRREVKEVERLIKDELAQLQEDEYLQSIPGVGWWGAAVFLGEVGDIGKYPRARSIEKLAGLNLWHTQSGKMESKLKITHRGRSLLRKMAYQLAVSGTHGAEEFREFYQRKLKRGKPKVSALVALSAKILRVMYGVVKNEEQYRPLKEWAGDAVGFQEGPC